MVEFLDDAETELKLVDELEIEKPENDQQADTEKTLPWKTLKQTSISYFFATV